MPLLLASRRSGAHRQPGSYNHVLWCTRDRDPASSTWGEQELKKNHRNNARGREVQAGWEGRVTSHTQTPRLRWGWQGPSDPAGNSSPSAAFGASSTWRAERQRSAMPSLPELLDPRSWHSRDVRPPLEPGAALAPERLQPGPVGRGQKGPQQQQPCPCSRRGGGGWVSTEPGSGGAPSPFPAGLRCSSHAVTMHGADSRRFRQH